jgi:opacity protein-like surface antigen
MIMSTKRFITLCAAAILICPFAYGDSFFKQLHPVFTLTTGFAAVNKINNSTTVSIPDQSTNTYTNNTAASNPFLMGVFAGAEFSSANNLIYQVGLSYSQIGTSKINGTLYQLSDPNFGNFSYQYSVATQLLMLDSKLLFTTHRIWHPYVSLGLGAAMNHATGYTQTAITPGAVDLDAPFANGTSTGLAYALGFGVDVTLPKNFRVGLGYRYANLGKPQLGSSPSLSGSGPTSNTLTANEILLQLTYVV